MRTLQADPFALNEFFKKTAERLVRQNPATDDVILSDIDSLTSSHDIDSNQATSHILLNMQQHFLMKLENQYKKLKNIVLCS